MYKSQGSDVLVLVKGNQRHYYREEVHTWLDKNENCMVKVFTKAKEKINMLHTW